MPKIIENLAQDILNEARKIIDTQGLEGLNVRSLSSNLGIAPSTLYNYYRNKEEIVGALLQRCWQEALTKIDDESIGKTVTETLTLIVKELRASVKPIIHVHLAFASKNKSEANCSSDHAVNAQKKMMEQLQIRVKALFEQQEREYEDIDSIVTVVSKLIMACIHDNSLEITDIIDTVKNI